MKSLQWANFVKMHRKRQGLTLRQLGHLAGIDGSYVTLIERDGVVPRKDKVLALARALGVNEDHMLLEAGYAPESITGTAILGRQDPEFSEGTLIPDLSNTMRELYSLNQAQQQKVAELLSAYVYTLKQKGRARHRYVSYERSIKGEM